MLFALFLGLSSQTTTIIYYIDDFSVDSPAIVIVTPSGGVTSTIVSADFVSDSHIIGEERDLELDVLSGTGNVVESTGVSEGAFNGAGAQQAAATAYLVYDGPDSSTNLDASGLFPYNVDFTTSNAYALQTNITSDTLTNVYFRVYSGSASSYCQYSLSIPGDSISRLYIMKYTDFTTVGSGCDFTNLGALEVEVDLAENVDILIQEIEIIADQVSATPTSSRTPSPSPAGASSTPSRSVSPSMTRTPTPSKVVASASNTPTRSGSASPSPSASGCLCTCPEFECYMFNMGSYSFTGIAN